MNGSDRFFTVKVKKVQIYWIKNKNKILIKLTTFQMSLMVENKKMIKDL